MILLPYFEGTMDGDGGENLKGAFWNVGLHNTREDFVRAVFEGIAFMLQDHLEHMLGKHLPKSKQLISIGGASKSSIWSQIKADVTGCRIVTMPGEEAALLGCACIAAVGSGWYPSFEEALGRKTDTACYVPNKINEDCYQALYKKYRCMKESMEQLSVKIQQLGI